MIEKRSCPKIDMSLISHLLGHAFAQDEKEPIQNPLRYFFMNTDCFDDKINLVKEG